MILALGCFTHILLRALDAVGDVSLIPQRQAHRQIVQPARPQFGILQRHRRQENALTAQFWKMHVQPPFLQFLHGLQCANQADQTAHGQPQPGDHLWHEQRHR